MRSINAIAYEIKKDWPKPYFGAVPYIHAMVTLTDINDYYYEDPAREIITYFLGNAQTWRGEVARRVKKELKEMIER